MINNLDLDIYDYNSLDDFDKESHKDFFFGTGVNWTPLHIENIFTDNQCELIKELGYSLIVEDALTVGNGFNETIRKSKTSWLPKVHKTMWIYKQLAKLVQEANKNFQYDITGFHEKIQFTAYTDQNSHYDYHVDLHNFYPARKLSIVVLLDDPKTFEGGDLIFRLGNKDDKAIMQKGSGVIFPSFVLHKVKPLISGKRHSLVAWICGPNFR